MYRIITTYRDQGRARPIIEHGPWHPTLPIAERWADTLRTMGYVVSIESQSGPGRVIEGNQEKNDNHLLAEALANMA